MLNRIENGIKSFRNKIKEFLADPVVEQLSPEDPNAVNIKKLFFSPCLTNWRREDGVNITSIDQLGVARMNYSGMMLYLLGPADSVKSLKYAGFQYDADFFDLDSTFKLALESTSPVRWFWEVAKFHGNRLTLGISGGEPNDFVSGSYGSILDVSASSGEYIYRPNNEDLNYQVLLVDCRVISRDGGLGGLRIFSEPVADKR